MTLSMHIDEWMSEYKTTSDSTYGQKFRLRKISMHYTAVVAAVTALKIIVRITRAPVFLSNGLFRTQWDNAAVKAKRDLLCVGFML